MSSNRNSSKIVLCSLGHATIALEKTRLGRRLSLVRFTVRSELGARAKHAMPTNKLKSPRFCLGIKKKSQTKYSVVTFWPVQNCIHFVNTLTVGEKRSQWLLSLCHLHSSLRFPLCIAAKRTESTRTVLCHTHSNTRTLSTRREKIRKCRSKCQFIQNNQCESRILLMNVWVEMISWNKFYFSVTLRAYLENQKAEWPRNNACFLPPFF